MNPSQEPGISQQIPREEDTHRLLNTDTQVIKDYLSHMPPDGLAPETQILIQSLGTHGSMAKKKNKKRLFIMLMHISSTHLMERHVLSDLLTHKELSRFIRTRRKIQRHLIQEILKADAEQLYLKPQHGHPIAALLLTTPLGRRLLQRSRALRARIDLSRLAPALNHTDAPSLDLEATRSIASDTHSLVFWSGYLNINPDARKSIIEHCSIGEICGLFFKKDHSFLNTLSLLKDKMLDSLTSEHRGEALPSITRDHIISQGSKNIVVHPIPSQPSHDPSIQTPSKHSNLEHSEHRGSSV